MVRVMCRLQTVGLIPEQHAPRVREPACWELRLHPLVGRSSASRRKMAHRVRAARGETRRVLCSAAASGNQFAADLPSPLVWPACCPTSELRITREGGGWLAGIVLRPFSTAYTVRMAGSWLQEPHGGLLVLSKR
jgi:hypothetical protein